MIFFYTLVGSFGSLAYADSVGDSVISSIETKWIQQAVNLMIALHCLTTVTLTINTVNQEVEEWFRIPHGMWGGEFIWHASCKESISVLVDKWNLKFHRKYCNRANSKFSNVRRLIICKNSYAALWVIRILWVIRKFIRILSSFDMLFQ